MKLRGGLGNQLFQWATGYSLAKRLGVRLHLHGQDITKIRSSVLGEREFELNYFGLRLSQLDEALGLLRDIQNRGLGQFGQAVKSSLHREQDFQFNPELLATNTPHTLVGYFQSWKYFASDFAAIRQSLVPTKERQTHLNSLLQSMPSADWVGIHIRRGDYLKVGTMSVLDSAYFLRAMSVLETRFQNLPKVVFSDDIESAREVFPGGDLYLGPREVPSSGDSLMLLSMSRALVCSNSSFSWWAAFLSPDRHEKVIFPNTWFPDVEMRWEDLLLPEWLRV